MNKTAIVLPLYIALTLLLTNPALAQQSQPDETIVIRAIPGLQFDITRFAVEPGTTIELILENDDSMMHNLLVGTPGSRESLVSAAEGMGAYGMEENYIPDSPDVLASIPVLVSNESASVIFQVPEEEGAYPFVCTFPGHGQVMFGAMYVTRTPGDLPPLAEDPNVPSAAGHHLADSPHPYPMTMPQMNRLFMPDASPAAIAVGMEQDISYTWDAGYSFLRYAWKGGYMDASRQWDRTSAQLAEIEGEIFFRNESGFPFRVGSRDSIPEPDFKGYAMIDGYPQFKYMIGDIIVHELITPREGGMEISYELENVTEPIWYTLGITDDVYLEASRGQWMGPDLSLNPEEATSFTIHISPQ